MPSGVRSSRDADAPPFLAERERALDARIGEPSARGAFLEAARATDHRVRRAGLRLLGEVGTGEDAEFLRSAVRDDRRETGIAAVEALVRLVERGVVPVETALPPEERSLDVVEIGVDRAVRHRVVEIGRAVPKVEWSHGPAYLPLLRVGGIALPVLDSVASDRSRFGTDVRAHALVATGRIGGPRAVEQLLGFLRGVDSLEERGPSATRFPIEEEDLSHLRAAAIAGLGFVGVAGLEGRASAMAACDRPDVTLRAYGAWTLFCLVPHAEEAIRAEIARAAAEDLFFEQDDSVLSTLALVLEASGIESHAGVLAERLAEYPRLVDFFLLGSLLALAPDSESARTTVARALERRDPAVRALALRHSGQPIPEALVDELRRMVEGATFGLSDETGTVAARSALVSLGFAGAAARSALDEVLALTDDAEGSVRAAAAVSLGGIGGERAIERLRELRGEDPNEYVRYFAGDALWRLGDPAAVPAMIDALETGNEFLAGSARGALRRLAGVDHGYDPGASSEHRAGAIEAWRAWWKDHGHRVRFDPGAGSLRLDNG